MWKCHKCGKPVYFAERRQSLGFSWHPECLRCEECGRRLEPGAHAEHKAAPYCHVPCYGALFGPQLFGHGSRVETHSSFGTRPDDRAAAPRATLEAKLKVFNQFHDGNSGGIRSREVNGRLVLEGALRIHWGVLGLIHLKEDDDQRTVVTIRKRNSRRFRDSSASDQGSDSPSAVDSGLGDGVDASPEESTVPSSMNSSVESSVDSSVESNVDSSVDVSPRSLTLPCKLDARRADWDELDVLLQVERIVDDTEKPFQTLPSGVSFHREPSIDSPPGLGIPDSAEASAKTSQAGSNKIRSTGNGNDNEVHANGNLAENTRNREKGDASKPTAFANRGHGSRDEPDSEGENVDQAELQPRGATKMGAAKTGAAAIRRRPGKRRLRAALRRRCSINGHFYDRETSFFTPPLGSSMSLWLSSLVSTGEVINLLLDKYKVDSQPANFALFVVHDNGEQRRLLETECPLVVRVMLGPHEDVSRVVLMDAGGVDVSADVAQFLNLSAHECRGILDQYRMEEEREAKRVRAKFREMRRRIKQRMEELKVRL